MTSSKKKNKPTGSIPISNKAPQKPLPVIFFFIPLIIACILVYGRTTGFGTTGFDDESFIISFSEHHYTIKDAFTHNAFMLLKGNGFYRPLQSLTFMLDAAIFNGQVSGFHLSSMILHCIAACAILWLFMLLGVNRLVSFFTALIFAMHPLFAQAIAWIPGRGDLLLGITGTLAFCFLIKLRISGHLFYLLGHSLAFFCALLSKESAVVLPLLFALYLFLADRKKLLSRSNLVLVSVWIVLVGFFFMLRSIGIGGLPSGGTVGLSAIVRSVRVLPEILCRFAVPFSIPLIPSFSFPASACGAAVIIGIGTALGMQKKLGRPLVILGAAWYLLLSIPGMAYRHELGSNAYDYLTHRAYLPIVGVLILLTEAVPTVWYREKKRLFSAASLGIAVLLGCLAFGQSAYFADPLIFNDRAAKTNPQSALALNNRGGCRHRAGDIAGALADYNAALALKPDYLDALVNRGNALGALGDRQGAIATLTHAIALDSLDSHAFNDRGLWEKLSGDTAACLADYSRAIKVRPDFAAAYSNRGEIFAIRGDYDRASADFQAAIDHDQRLSDPWFNLGLIRLLRGDTALACSLLIEANRRGNPKATYFLSQYCHR